jgi:hypothetical protein
VEIQASARVAYHGGFEVVRRTVSRDSISQHLGGIQTQTLPPSLLDLGRDESARRALRMERGTEASAGGMHRTRHIGCLFM